VRKNKEVKRDMRVEKKTNGIKKTEETTCERCMKKAETTECPKICSVFWPGR